LVAPIVRDIICQAPVSSRKHVLVYQTSSSLSGIKGMLHQIPELEFYVYGYNKEEKDKNVVFKTFSEGGFVHDLASAKAVIANGGFSFISEAVYLKKPVYAFPLQNQFEQFINAAYIEKLGYGRHFPELKADALKAFLYDLPHFTRNLAAYHQQGNILLLQTLEKHLEALQP